MATETWNEPGRANGPAAGWQPGYGTSFDEAERGRELAREDQQRIALRGEGHEPRRKRVLIETQQPAPAVREARPEYIEYEDKALRKAELGDRRTAYDREADKRNLLERERRREASPEERKARREEEAEREQREPRQWVQHDLRRESAGTLVSDFMTEAQFLVSQEMRLARAEMKQEATNAAKGATSIGVGGVVALVGALVLVACVVIALGALMPLWLSTLLVGGLMLLVGAMIAMGGVAKLKALNPKPERTAATLQEDREWASGLKRDVQSRRRGHA